jgi:regulatory protein YycH of two-component signal transduction system YycFG
LSKDSILGWTLILLVVISLFLSFTIWSRVPGHLSVARMIQDEKKVDPTTVVSPEKILVYLGNSFNTMLKTSSPLYDKTWNLSKNLLASQWTISPEPMDNINREYFTHKKGVEMFFPTPLPAPFLKQLFNISAGDTSTLDGKLIVSFLLIDEGELSGYLADSDGNFYKIGKAGDAEKLNSLIKEIRDFNPPLFASLTADVNLKVIGDVYVSLLSYELPIYSLKRESISEERLASNFFADFSVIRRIEERDGTVIYTDGQQGLRIYDNGAIEYNLPVSREQRKTQSLYEAFKTAIDFIATHGGWPKDAYLASYEVKSEPSGPTYFFRFKIRVNGFRIINFNDFMNVTVEGNQVKNYYRNISLITKQEGILDLMTPVEALNAAVSTKNIKVVNDIYPGYMIEGEELKPVWVVETAGMEVIIPNLSE